ncbi:hypothetical protein ANCCAN_03953 [Ancylostoma caninum]|uniref:Uncharacterized protein n=1 Tax=Ancylostoma caninum TaxID=29170 RepID=A0A368H3T7_ANCCA|nr:hypothetical protein ANCCAN_03953 [Ancylostoma caninum]
MEWRPERSDNWLNGVRLLAPHLYPSGRSSIHKIIEGGMDLHKCTTSSKCRLTHYFNTSKHNSPSHLQESMMLVGLGDVYQKWSQIRYTKKSFISLPKYGDLRALILANMSR